MGHQIGIESANQRVKSCVLVVLLGRGDIELIFFYVIISIIVEWDRWVIYSDKGILLVHKYSSQSLMHSSKALLSNESILEPYYMRWNRIGIIIFLKLGNNTFFPSFDIFIIGYWELVSIVRIYVLYCSCL